MSDLSRPSRLTAIALMLAAFGPGTARADVTTYLSLGDSIGFGEQTFANDPSNGDRGYVSLYADILASRTGGVRPNVINLAIPGETSSSLSSGSGRVPPGPGFSDGVLASLNTHYTAPYPTQFDLMVSTINSELSLGHKIGTVTVSLGSNDLFQLALTPGFLTDPPATQQALLLQALQTFAGNEANLLAKLQDLVPTAHIFVLGTYNPFPGDPTSPFAGVAGLAIPALNQTIQSVASAFHVTYVDTYSPFVGHEVAFTHIADPPAGSDNVHPTNLGYAAIATAIASVPEPSTFALLATGAIGLLAVGRRRRARATA